MPRSSLRLALAACAAAALTLAARAEQPPTFGESVDVRVVNVEVVVTDRNGNRVPNLPAADFRLRVDGSEVPIEYFSEIQEGRSIAALAGEEKPGAAGVQSVAPEGAVGTYYLVFIDDYFSTPPRRNDVLKALKADLGRLGAEDRMAVVAYDGGRLALLADWSASRADLEKALDQAMARTAHGFERATELRNLQGEQEFAKLATADGMSLDPNLARATDIGLNERERAYAETLVRQMRGSIGAAVSAMRGFAAPRGRKVMLLLSGGWPFSVVSFIRGPKDVAPSSQTASGEDLFRPLTGTANLLGYTVYPVDVPGIQATGATATDDPSPGNESKLTSGTGIGAAVRDFAPQAQPSAPKLTGSSEQEIEGPLYFIAKETGGKPILNTNRTAALASASADTRSYYWLGFSPSWQRNDQLHEIRIEMRRPGFDLRYRTSFRDLSRAAEVAMKVESALLLGQHPGALAMPIRLGKPQRTKQGGVQIPVTLGLPVEVMTALPVAGGYMTQVKLHFAASDDNGNSSDLAVLPVNLASAGAPEPGKFIRYDTTVTLHGKANHLVVAAYDPLSGKVATAEADLATP